MDLKKKNLTGALIGAGSAIAKQKTAQSGGARSGRAVKNNQAFAPNRQNALVQKTFEPVQYAQLPDGSRNTVINPNSVIKMPLENASAVKYAQLPDGSRNTVIDPNSVIKMPYTPGERTIESMVEYAAPKARATVEPLMGPRVDEIKTPYQPQMRATVEPLRGPRVDEIKTTNEPQLRATVEPLRGPRVDEIKATQSGRAMANDGLSHISRSGQAVNPAGITQSYYTQPSTADNYDQNKPIYTQSDALLAAGLAVAEAEQNKPGAYQSSYGDRINGMIDDILNRPNFQYDPSADPLYQQYAQQYQRNGELAMQDAMAQTSALTGGYGNTYAQLAGQQGYQRYMEDLNAMLPQLQQAAYQMYQDEGNTMYNNLGMLQNADQVDYGRYRDTVGDWRSDLDYLYGKYNNMSQEEYNRYLNDRQSWENDRDYWYQQAQDQKNWDWMREQFEYQKQQDELARQQSSGGRRRSSNSGGTPSFSGIASLLNTGNVGLTAGLAAGVNNAQMAQAIQNTLKPENTAARNNWLDAAAEQQRLNALVQNGRKKGNGLFAAAVENSMKNRR